eukprot:TRINITY_DN355_c0_g1_i5.p1 TRINITY_DN355_c0_g1~~TRINITY_DN355_c0_g1_i5.p1  ORF type:complete len:331 (-),score=87.63 TRINITY_DN355_c0_g1_i5:140-1132(-)
MVACTPLMKILLTSSASRMENYQSRVLTMVSMPSTGVTRVTVVQPIGGKSSRFVTGSLSHLSILLLEHQHRQNLAKINFGNYDKVRIDDLIISEEHYGDENIVGKRKKREGGNERLEAGTIKNNGHTAQLDVVATLPGDVGVLTGGPLDGAYQILQLHFHWGSDDTKGSEHTLDGKMFPMELHIVHKKVGVEVTEALNMTGGLAVTGFFFEVDAADNAAIEPLVAALANVANPDEKYDMAGSAFKITDLIAGVAPLTAGETYKYSSYSGSLTTPGCMEVVSWINFIDTIKISAKQLKAFRALKDGKNADIVDNFRPVQELYGRTVTFYGA